jgi:hypothetical protein
VQGPCPHAICISSTSAPTGSDAQASSRIPGAVTSDTPYPSTAITSAAAAHTVSNDTGPPAAAAYSSACRHAHSCRSTC